MGPFEMTFWEGERRNFYNALFMVQKAALVILTAMISLVKISRYEIKEELGRGGMATVYRAWDPLFEREVAIKVLPHELLHNKTFLERFEREAKIIARVEHAAIVPVYDVGRDKETELPYFVMRYMTGGSLARAMKAGTLTLEDVARIMNQVASGLDFAHAKGIVHRDLKPDNILFDENGDAFISDFGIAKLSQSNTNLTGTGVVGTPSYMSPEQGLGEDVDGRSDIYSLGAILFELLSGQPPYEAKTPLAVLYKHANEPIPHILDLNPNLPPTVEMVVEKALAKKPEDRYPIAAILARAFDSAVRGEVPELDYKKTQPYMAALPKSAFGTPPPIAIRTPTPLPAPAAAVEVAKPRFPWLPIFGGLAILILIGFATWKWILPAARPEPTATVTPTLAATPVPDTPTEAPSPTSAPTDIPVIAPTIIPSPTATPPPGRADKIAFIASNDIWTMNSDGSGIFQLTNDDTAKFDLQWLPGGQEILYAQGKCVYVVALETSQRATVACFEVSDVFDAFQVSPDGKQVAIGLDGHLLIAPFDRDQLSQVVARKQLSDLDSTCLDYAEEYSKIKQALWSQNGKTLAVMLETVRNGKNSDVVQVIDITRCRAADPLVLAEFPGRGTTPTGYTSRPDLPSYSWDGGSRFLINTFVRNDGYGDLYLYDMDADTLIRLNPIAGACCYRDARFSPDGQYILFMFQDIGQGQESKTEMYYVPFDQLGTGVTFKPFKLPPLLFPNPREKIRPVMRPIQ
jgi:serine/threonine-protein kinase